MAHFIQQTAQGRHVTATDPFLRQPRRCTEQHPIRQDVPLLIRQRCQGKGRDSSHLTASPQQHRLLSRHQHAGGHRLKRIPHGCQHSLGRRPCRQLRPMQSLLHQVSLQLLGRLPSAAADQPIHGHPKGREHSLSCRGSSWDTFRQQQWTAQLCTKTHPLAPQPFHSLRIHGPSRGQTPRRPRLWGLQTQVGKRGLVLQTQRRHKRLHRKALQRHMAQQGGRDTSGEGRQRPTP